MIIDLPYPAKALWPNGRPHFMAKAREAKKHRAWANLATLEVKPACFKHNGEPIPVTIYVHAKPRGPLPDEDNCVAACKSMLDGIADALGVNDKAFKAPKVVFAQPREGRFAVKLFDGKKVETDFGGEPESDVTGGSA